MHFMMGLSSLALALFLAWGAIGLAIDHRRSGDFDQWVDQPGVLESLVLRPTVGGDSRDLYVDCHYAYEVDGRTYRGTTFDFQRPGFAMADHARAHVERELDLKGKVAWKRVQRDGIDEWVLQPAGLAITVSRSPHAPEKSTLTATPPESPATTWAAIGVLSVLAVIFLPIGIGLLLPDRRRHD